MVPEKTLAEAITSIIYARSVAEMSAAFTRHRELPDPHIPYYAGVWHLMRKERREALPYLLRAVNLGREVPGPFWSTKSADAVGSSAALVLVNTKGRNEETLQANLALYGYGYLSRCIDLLGIRAFESLENRAKLLVAIEGRARMPCLPVNALLQPLLVSDYFDAAQGQRSAGDPASAQRCLQQATRWHNWMEDIQVDGRDADEYSLSQMAEVGRKRHQSLKACVYATLKSGRSVLGQDDLLKLYRSIEVVR